jgi:hypothetical protein
MGRELGWSEEQVELRMRWIPTRNQHVVIEGHHSFHEEDVLKDMPRMVSEALLIYAGRGNLSAHPKPSEAPYPSRRGRDSLG